MSGRYVVKLSGVESHHCKFEITDDPGRWARGAIEEHICDPTDVETFAEALREVYRLAYDAMDSADFIRPAEVQK